ncbi:MAG: hypothetical protein MI785_17055 [Kiloniellales bacterium]|nr:hypothetical protein [Kiloniellales bacterium]
MPDMGAGRKPAAPACAAGEAGPRAEGRRDDAKIRVLVLTSSTGGGHNARAEAFRAWVRKLYGRAVEVRIDHTLEDSSPWYAFGVNLYNTIQRREPFFHHLYYHVGEVFGSFQRRRIRVGRRYFDRLLRDFRPDVILSVHSILNRGYFRHAKRVLGDRVFCVTYCGEFKGSYGFSRNWVAEEVDLFLGRTPLILESAQKYGLPGHKAKCLGHLLKPSFYDRRMSATERSAYLIERLGLAADRFTLLLATGGAGAQNHAALLDSLLKHAGRLQAIVLCGQSDEVREDLRAWQARHPGFGLAVLPHSDEMGRLLQVASAVVARPGTTTTAEALQSGCPIIFNRIGGTMPQEYCTLRYFRILDLAPCVFAPGEIARRLDPWLTEPETYERYLARFRAAKMADDPEALVAAVLEPALRAAATRRG